MKEAEQVKNHNSNCWIVGVGMEDRSYTVNGVKYVVSSRFAPTRIKEKREPTLSDRLHSYIGSGFAKLTIMGQTDIIADEYACSAAGEED